ncbi:[FeFe] hydrogenase, group A [Bengtsoniella intestinalis]|uniref:[FeFe] hydrogenase, group A n=1 Tax=Bengtsoniella intestinalis TaxID=3073143 RepID=UPI00391FCA11
MVNLTINNQPVSVPEGTTLMEAAKEIGVHVPSLCYLKDLNEIAACRVCVVELEGSEKLITSCNNVAQEGMVIHTNSPKVRANRRNTVELILSQHDARCAICSKSRNCLLQDVANDLGIQGLPYEQHYEKRPWNKKFPLIRDSAKCIKCMRCIQICDKVQSLGVWDVESTGSRTTVNVANHGNIEDANCSLCGQCITHCPVGALFERNDSPKVWDALGVPNQITVAQIAPAVRTAWGEEMGLSPDEATVGKIAHALKKMGVDYVFDTTFSADLTIMEEATEFLQRFTAGELDKRPMFTSCCPAWVRFLQSEFPHFLPQLSTAKSPQQMFGAVTKSYFAEKIGVNPENIHCISVMPCVAKKDECNKDLYYKEFAGKEVDTVITTRELVAMMRSESIHKDNLHDIPFDTILEDASGAGVIFGTTGGVMEAALRTAYATIMGRNPSPDDFAMVRNSAKEENGILSANLQIGAHTVNIAVTSGLAHARTLLKQIEDGTAHYHFVEVMACPGGCVGGGGQPVRHGEELAPQRGQTLYALDGDAPVRFSHENKDVQALYADFMGEPCGHLAHQLLHTSHQKQ